MTTEVKDKALNIAFGTFLSNWDGKASDVYTKLLNEDPHTDSLGIEYITVWQPFEDDTIGDVLANIEVLAKSIFDEFIDWC